MHLQMVIIWAKTPIKMTLNSKILTAICFVHNDFIKNTRIY